MTLESDVGADIGVGVGVGVGVGARGGSVVIKAEACDASSHVTSGVNDETRRVEAVTLECAVGADVGVADGVDAGARVGATGAAS